MTAIAGTRRQYKEMADGTLRVSIDIDPQYKQNFLELFPGIDMPVALAPLEPDFEQKKPEPEQKGGPLSKSAAMQCAYKVFQAFLRDKYAEDWKLFDCIDATDQAAHVLRYICGVESRADLDHEVQAAARYQELMREYQQWNVVAPIDQSGEQMKSAHARGVSWICDQCAKDSGGVMPVPENHCATYHYGKCDVCKEDKSVTQSRDYSWLMSQSGWTR